eukprot:scaffold28921_cov53-Attheya_sp.AAC.2
MEWELSVVQVRDHDESHIESHSCCSDFSQESILVPTLLWVWKGRRGGEPESAQNTKLIQRPIAISTHSTATRYSTINQLYRSCYCRSYGVPVRLSLCKDPDDERAITGTAVSIPETTYLQ